MLFNWKKNYFQRYNKIFWGRTSGVGSVGWRQANNFLNPALHRKNNIYINFKKNSYSSNSNSCNIFTVWCRPISWATQSCKHWCHPLHGYSSIDCMSRRLRDSWHFCARYVVANWFDNTDQDTDEHSTSTDNTEYRCAPLS